MQGLRGKGKGIRHVEAEAEAEAEVAWLGQGEAVSQSGVSCAKRYIVTCDLLADKQRELRQFICAPHVTSTSHKSRASLQATRIGFLKSFHSVKQR